MRLLMLMRDMNGDPGKAHPGQLQAMILHRRKTSENETP
jgi:hypothetical protein